MGEFSRFSSYFRGFGPKIQEIRIPASSEGTHLLIRPSWTRKSQKLIFKCLPLRSGAKKNGRAPARAFGARRRRAKIHTRYSVGGLNSTLWTILIVSVSSTEYSVQLPQYSVWAAQYSVPAPRGGENRVCPNQNDHTRDRQVPQINIQQSHWQCYSHPGWMRVALFCLSDRAVKRTPFNGGLGLSQWSQPE